MHWLFLIDRKWLFLFGSTWLIRPDANTVQVKPISANKKGYGTYKVTVKGDKYYNNATFTKKIKVLPHLGLLSIADRKDNDYLYNLRYFVPYSANEVPSYIKNKDIKGIEYEIGELKSKKKGTGKNAVTVIYKDKFTKNSKKGSITFSKVKPKMIKNSIWGEKGFLLASFDKLSHQTIFELKYRTYVMVNGKKLYSDWHVSISPSESEKYVYK